MEWGSFFVLFPNSSIRQSKKELINESKITNCFIARKINIFCLHFEQLSNSEFLGCLGASFEDYFDIPSPIITAGLGWKKELFSWL